MKILFNKYDYIFGTKLELDLKEITQSCLNIDNQKNIFAKPIKEVKEIYFSLQNKEKKENPEFYSIMKDCYTFQKFSYYGCLNLFTFPFPGIHSLYTSIKNNFNNINKDNKKYYIDGWVNIFKKETKNIIDWHSHFHKSLSSWHGFFCVNVGTSKTSYRLPDIKEEVDVIGENNLLVLAKGGGDQHRTYPWEEEGMPRITIGYNIVPEESINPEMWFNYWTPL